MTARELILDAMDTLTQMPMGGVGVNGPTQAELDAATAECHSIEMDAYFHIAQQAWRTLERALGEIAVPFEGCEACGGTRWIEVDQSCGDCDCCIAGQPCSLGGAKEKVRCPLCNVEAQP